MTSAFVNEALDRGAELFDWDERKARSRAAARIEGARRRRRGRTARRRIDRLRRPDDDPSRRQAVRAVGRRQPRHAFGDRPRARRRRSARDAVGEGRGHLGRHGQGPALDLPLGRQPDDACDDARELMPARWTRSGSCRKLRRRISAARRTTTSSANERVFRRGNPGARPDLRAGGDARDRAWRQVRRPRAAGRHPRR